MFHFIQCVLETPLPALADGFILRCIFARPLFAPAGKFRPLATFLAAKWPAAGLATGTARSALAGLSVAAGPIGAIKPGFQLSLNAAGGIEKVVVGGRIILAHGYSSLGAAHLASGLRGR